MPAPDIQTLYDLETPVEKMLAHLFGAAGVANYCPANATFVTTEWQDANPELAEFILSAESDLTRHIPRVDFVVRITSATMHLADTDPPRCDAYEGQIELTLTTKFNYAQHRTHRAMVRKLMGDTFPTTHTPYHHIGKCIEAGTSLEIETENDLMQTTLTYDIHVGIDPTQWPS